MPPPAPASAIATEVQRIETFQKLLAILKGRINVLPNPAPVPTVPKINRQNHSAIS
jgi:hypothetical protein